MKKLIPVFLLAFAMLADATITKNAGAPRQTAVQENGVELSSKSGADSQKKNELPRPRIQLQAAATRHWKGSAEELAALKEKIRDSIRRTEGRDIDLEALTITSANAGDTAIGKVIYEGEGQIVVDNHPCKDKMSEFRDPYVKESAQRTVKCGGKAFEIFIVEQR